MPVKKFLGVAWYKIPHKGEAKPTDLSVEEFRDKLDQMRGLPVCFEHNKARVIGRVNSAEITKNKRLLLEYEMDDEDIADKIGKGLYPSLSLSHNAATGAILEVSVVEKPHRDGCNAFTMPPDTVINCSDNEQSGGGIDKAIDEYINSRPELLLPPPTTTNEGMSSSSSATPPVPPTPPATPSTTTPAPPPPPLPATSTTSTPAVPETKGTANETPATEKKTLGDVSKGIAALKSLNNPDIEAYLEQIMKAKELSDMLAARKREEAVEPLRKQLAAMYGLPSDHETIQALISQAANNPDFVKSLLALETAKSKPPQQEQPKPPTEQPKPPAEQTPAQQPPPQQPQQQQQPTPPPPQPSKSSVYDKLLENYKYETSRVIEPPQDAGGKRKRGEEPADESDETMKSAQTLSRTPLLDFTRLMSLFPKQPEVAQRYQEYEVNASSTTADVTRLEVRLAKQRELVDSLYRNGPNQSLAMLPALGRPVDDDSIDKESGIHNGVFDIPYDQSIFARWGLQV